MSDIYTITRNLSLQIDNDIEEFIVRSVQEYGMNESITVNAKKIYEALEKQVAKKVIYKPKDAVYQRPFCPCCDTELFDANYSINRCECGQLLMYCG